MATGLALSVLALVVAVDSGSATVDRGLVHGLLPGDQGNNYFELTVDETVHRVDVGRVWVEGLAAETAMLRAPAGIDLKVGSSVRFEIPGERISDSNIIAAARRHLPETEAEAVVDRLVDGLVASADPSVREAIQDRLAPPPETTSQGAVSDESAMLRIPKGQYWIGVASEVAEFFNEQPRHRVRLDSYWIDRQAVSPSEEERSHREAERFCAERGKRLPTEAEWETAVRQRSIEPAEFFEWTASSYSPYPGNRVEEAEYGRGYRVLRGDVDSAAFRAARRRFMAPKLKGSSVGFRCARSDRSGS